MANFIELPVEASAQELIDRAIDRLQLRWPDWTPSDANLEVVMMEAIASIAQDVAETASRVPSAIFRAYGLAVLGIPYAAAQSATSTVTFTYASGAGSQTIPAGTEVLVDGFAFHTRTATTGTSPRAGIVVDAIEPGAAANGLAGATVEMLTSLAFVQSVTLDTPTSGGVDAEDDSAYQDRLSDELRLQAKTLVTLEDYEIMALGQAGIGRAVALNDGDRAVRIVVTDASGEVVPNPIKAALVNLYSDYREVNTTFTVADASYTTINVAWTGTAYPGYDTTDVRDRVNAALADYLSPPNWGKQVGAEADVDAWINDPIVRLYKIVDLMGNVEGLNYVQTLTLNGAASDVVMPGVVALPRPGTMTGTVAAG